MDLIVLMHANFAEWDFNCVPADLKINNGYIMQALGTVQNLFISKNALLSQNLKKAKVVQIGSQWYFNISEKQVKKEATNVVAPKSENIGENQLQRQNTL
jgi:hypothetical protein